MTPVRRAALLALPLLALGACAELDPYTREGVWRPAGVNAANLRAMVAVPSELQQGTDYTGPTGQAAAAAVERLREDRVRPLPAVQTGAFQLPGGGAN